MAEFLKRDSVIAYDVLQTVSVFGFPSLLAIHAVGKFKATANVISRGGVARTVFLIALIAVMSGCAAPARLAKPDFCEDLTQTAPVDDWAEERFCLWHPIKCYKAHALRKATEQWQNDMAGKYWTAKDRNGLGDAGRHAHLMCVLAERFGAEFARGLGVAHEEDSEYRIFFRKAAPGNPCCEKVMDLHNNEIGIGLAGKPGSCEERVLSSLHLLRHSLCPAQGKGVDY